MSAAQQRVASQPPVGADHITPWDLSEVIGDVFNPRNFFNLPRILGVIDIGEAVLPTMMERQPKLKEVYDYALDMKDEAEEAVATAFGEVAGQAAALVDKALDDAERKLVEFLHSEGILTVPDSRNSPMLPGGDRTYCASTQTSLHVSQPWLPH